MTSNLLRIFADVLAISELEATEAVFGKTPSWDSFNHLRLISRVQIEFGVKFQFEELIQMKSYDDFAKSVGAIEKPSTN